MKKKLLVIISIALLCGACEDQTSEILTKKDTETVITDEMRAQVKDVTNLLNSTSIATRNNITREVEEIRPLYVRDAELEESKIKEWGLKKDEPVGIVVNYKDDKGYVIMSNDPQEPSIVTMNTEGKVAPHSRLSTQSAKSLVGPKLKQDSLYALPDEPVYTKKYGNWEIVKEVAPMLAAKNIHYHQTAPFNMFCPYLSSGPVIRQTHDDRLAAGCAPVAYAQVMAYYERPKINWNSAYRTDENTNEVARLIREIGKELHAQYHGDGTFVCPYSAKTLRSEVRFAHLLPFIDLTSDILNDDMSKPFKLRHYSHPGKWQNYKLKNILSDLNNSRPVIVLGMSEGYKYFQHLKTKKLWINGHYFVVDGYMVRRRIIKHYRDSELYSQEVQEETLLHCNMGHKSSFNDGYYHSGLFDLNKGPVTKGFHIGKIFHKVTGFIGDFFEETFGWAIDSILRPLDTPIPLGEVGQDNVCTHYLHTLSTVKP